MKKHLLTLCCITALVLSTLYTRAQEAQDTLTPAVARNSFDIEALKRIKLSGYIQAQYQVADSAGQQSFNGGNFPAGTDKRFAVRRGRIKFQYDALPNEKGISTSEYVMQFDVTEKGLTIKDVYARFTDKWIGWFSLTAGMQNRPFGYEIIYSSSMRESPERGRMSQIIFPGERDLGSMITIQGPKTSSWNWLKLDAGFFNGTGARGPGLDASDFDKKKDFIGRLGISKSTTNEKIKYGLGVSTYIGGFRQDQSNSYKYGTDSNGVKAFVIDVKKADVATDISARKSIKRNYLGADAQLSIDWLIGLTTLRAEYIQGVQPATSVSSASATGPATSTVTNNTTAVIQDTAGNFQTVITGTTSTTVASDLYSRNFNGVYFYFLQNIMQTPLQLIVKYDWYDPNTDVKGDDIGQKVSADENGVAAKATNSTDIKYSTLGLGLAYRYDANIKFTAYYDMVTNETSANVPGYTKDLKDNVFTLRMQVKF